jgi:PAS domain S-box-containing protein
MARDQAEPHRDELRIRARQQEAVAGLGQRALAGMKLGHLLDEAAATAAQGLETEYAAVLEQTSDGHGLLVRAGYGLPSGVLGAVLPAGPQEMPGYALQSDGAVIVEDFGEETRFGPTALQREHEIVSAMVAPFGARGRHFGVIGVHSASARHFSPGDAHFLQSLANVLGAAVERARHDDVLRDSEARFRELADTAPAMIWTTDERGLVTFVNAGWMRFTGTTLEEELGATWTLGVHPDDAERLQESWDEALAERRPWEREYRLRARHLGYRWISDRGVPRYVGGRFVGYVGTAIDIHERKTMETQLALGYEQEHRIAEMLQRSLLPERLPDIEGLELVPRYLPASAGAAIGGDWYDALERPDGRVALVVGDIVGHGLRAAAAMGQLRNAFRAYGLVEASPAEVVARINRLVTSGVEEAMATVLYLVLDRETGEVTFTSAGHPPPLLVAPDGARFLDGGRSVPVGAADTAVFREGTALIPPGSSLVLYTDGLVERRDVPLERRLDDLARVASPPERDLDRLCDRILTGVLGDRVPADDVALLAVRPKPVPLDRFNLSLPADPGSLVVLRRRLGRFLHATGASEAETYEVTLTVCEAAGNAIEHAYGPEDATFEVDAAFEGGELVATVRDSGSWRERRSEHRGRGLAIIKGLMDDVEVAAEDRGTVVRMRRRLGEYRAA